MTFIEVNSSLDTGISYACTALCVIVKFSSILCTPMKSKHLRIFYACIATVLEDPTISSATITAATGYTAILKTDIPGKTMLIPLLFKIMHQVWVL